MYVCSVGKFGEMVEHLFIHFEYTDALWCYLISMNGIMWCFPRSMRGFVEAWKWCSFLDNGTVLWNLIVVRATSNAISWVSIPQTSPWQFWFFFNEIKY